MIKFFSLLQAVFSRKEPQLEDDGIRIPEIKVQPRKLAEDVGAWVDKDFANNERPEARKLLMVSQLGDREQRCALFVAKGELARLRSAIDLGQSDFRDLIMAGEYERGTRKQVRVFCQPVSS